MMKLRKIGEIRCFIDDGINDIVKTLKNQGFLVVDDNEREDNYKRYYILKEE